MRRRVVCGQQHLPALFRHRWLGAAGSSRLVAAPTVVAVDPAAARGPAMVTTAMRHCSTQPPSTPPPRRPEAGSEGSPSTDKVPTPASTPAKPPLEGPAQASDGGTTASASATEQQQVQADDAAPATSSTAETKTEATVKDVPRADKEGAVSTASVKKDDSPSEESPATPQKSPSQEEEDASKEMNNNAEQPEVLKDAADKETEIPTLPKKPPIGDGKPPRGFEHFYRSGFSKQADTDWKVSINGISAEEEKLNDQTRQNTDKWRRRWVGGVLLGGVLAYLIFGNSSFKQRLRNSSWFATHATVATIEHFAALEEQHRILEAAGATAGSSVSAAVDEQQQQAASEEQEQQRVQWRQALSIKEGTRSVWIDLDRHLAKLFDDRGRLICVSSFVDVGALKARISAWRATVTTKVVENDTTGESSKDSDSNDAAAANDGDASTATNTREYELVEQIAPDVYYTVPTHFPYAAIMFLWLLPLLVGFNRNLTMQVRAAGAAAKKAGDGKPARFKLHRDVKTKLDDVAGLTEVKVEVTEIVHMLKNPSAYTRLGARVPKGVLIDGPPGVGKTLLAKAVAGEAQLPFISCSGSEFDEVYVGVGAKRVRELFATAKKNKPCIIFIDEIDTFGRKRRNDRGGSRATINAVLNELDGFTESSDVMVLAATNRADTLDDALTRSGRFDRKISVDMPPHKDRVAIAKVHLKPINLAPSLSIDSMAETLATMSPGCSGADIYNICNEAAITASRDGKDYVDLDCFYKSLDRITIGLEKKAKKLTNDERERLAFHEAGHVVLTWFLETSDPVLKATISPRGGRTSGVTKKLPKDRFINTQTELRDGMVNHLGGYVAEEFFFRDVSSGAADDLRQVTNMAKHEVATYGMDPQVGHFGWPEDDQAIQRPYGAQKADTIDGAVRNITEGVLRRARDLLREHVDDIRVVAGLLLKNESVTARELWVVLGERPNMTEEFRKYLETAAN